MDKKDLKILALTQRIGEITAEKEAIIADLRVELTVLSQQQGEADVEVAPSGEADVPAAEG